MTQWWVLYKKEMMEMWRSFKWLWLPLVFVLLGAMQPISTYYMPQILEAAGGLPEGAVIEIPTPTGGEMMAGVLGQYGLLGVLVLVLAGMGIVAGEKQTRAVSLVMVRPVSHFSFISSKWAAFVTLGVASVVAGSLAGWYYTELLIGSVPGERVLSAIPVYAVWLIFVMTLTVLMSTLLKGSSAVAFTSIISTIGISALTGVLSRFMAWSPSRLSGHAAQLLSVGETGEKFALSLGAAVVLIAVMLTVSVLAFKKQELAD